MPDRRTQLADAALTVVAAKGLKGLTHRAVDAAAAVSEGTTSNYFRSRAALVAAAVDRLEQRDQEVWQSLGAAEAPRDIAGLATGLAGAILALAQDHADLVRARLAFALDQPASVAPGHRRFLAALEQLLQPLGVAGAPSRARAVADYCDGLMLHAITARLGQPLDRHELAAAIARLLG